MTKLVNMAYKLVRLARCSDHWPDYLSIEVRGSVLDAGTHMGTLDTRPAPKTI